MTAKQLAELAGFERDHFRLRYGPSEAIRRRTLWGFLNSGSTHTSAITDYTSMLNGNNYVYPVNYYDGMIYTDNSIVSPGFDPGSATNLVMTGMAPGTTLVQYDEGGTDYAYIPDQEQCVASNHYLHQEGTEDVTPIVTFSPVSDFPLGSARGVVATVTNSQGQEISSANSPVHIVLTGGATFPDLSTDMTITGTTTIVIVGSNVSSTENGVRLDAQIVNSGGYRTSVASPAVQFTVVNVVLSLQNSGSLASDNSATSFLPLAQRSLSRYIYGSAGNTSCAVPYQITGIVSPADYTKVITLRRTATARGYTNGTLTLQRDSVDDPGSEVLRDTDPQSGGSSGKVYDADQPSSDFDVTDQPITNRRLRANFEEYAVLGNPSVAVSGNLALYTRVSCTLSGSGIAFDDSLPGDNQAGLGTTPLTNDLQYPSSAKDGL